ncbi:MAG: hypothetical protein ABIH28_01915 [archaeon]
MRLVDAFLHGKEFEQLITDYVDFPSEKALENLRNSTRDYKKNSSTFLEFLAEGLGSAFFTDFRFLNPFSNYSNTRNNIGYLL